MAHKHLCCKCSDIIREFCLIIIVNPNLSVRESFVSMFSLGFIRNINKVIRSFLIFQKMSISPQKVQILFRTNKIALSMCKFLEPIRLLYCIQSYTICHMQSQNTFHFTLYSTCLPKSQQLSDHCSLSSHSMLSIFISELSHNYLFIIPFWKHQIFGRISWLYPRLCSSPSPWWT